ncbi:hypothetical protein [Deinococcus sp. Leaf326]|uniref:hypothetical protein n=1 Tax=Deinococcus sp. Leaf326 TaxID=1736338 RepID=UPI0006FAA754|nr:hypothetical protein [Deinococcus sp. Leaf326]KQR19349.1 hypothetical protein ASF71_19625 [Deinococcus sp. Leaf326]
MRAIIYEAGFEQRQVYVLPNGRFTVQAASDLLVTGGLNEPKRVLALSDEEVLQALHTAAPELVVPDGLQIWQVRHPEQYSLLGPQAPFPEAYRLCAVLLEDMTLEEAFERTQHGIVRDPVKGMVEDDLAWPSRPGVWSRDVRTVSSSVGDVYVQRDQAWRVQGVGFKCLTAPEVRDGPAGERGQADVSEGA